MARAMAMTARSGVARSSWAAWRRVSSASLISVQPHLPGGDAAAQNPVQAAAGFLAQLDDLPDFTKPPFCFPERYRASLELVRKNVRSFTTTSVGRLFDTAAALLGFTRPISFEGQAAIWLEQLALRSGRGNAYPFPFVDQQLDYRPLLQAVICDRLCGKDPAEIARAFQRGISQGLHDVALTVCATHQLDTIVLSGGVFQNELLLRDFRASMAIEPVQIWTNHAVPPNDGGISLGQAALAAFSHLDQSLRTTKS